LWFNVAGCLVVVAVGWLMGRRQPGFTLTNNVSHT
jgi:hypothetical protein